jgi:hypothetical protein
MAVAHALLGVAYHMLKRKEDHRNAAPITLTGST